MAYVAVSGGKEAIEESIKLLDFYRSGTKVDIDLAAIENKMCVRNIIFHRKKSKKIISVLLHRNGLPDQLRDPIHQARSSRYLCVSSIHQVQTGNQHQ